jgi:hypothetical protein
MRAFFQIKEKTIFSEQFLRLEANLTTDEPRFLAVTSSMTFKLLNSVNIGVFGLDEGDQNRI